MNNFPTLSKYGIKSLHHLPIRGRKRSFQKIAKLIHSNNAKSNSSKKNNRSSISKSETDAIKKYSVSPNFVLHEVRKLGNVSSISNENVTSRKLVGLSKLNEPTIWPFARPSQIYAPGEAFEIDIYREDEDTDKKHFMFNQNRSINLFNANSKYYDDGTSIDDDSTNEFDEFNPILDSGEPDPLADLKEREVYIESPNVSDNKDYYNIQNMSNRSDFNPHKEESLLDQTSLNLVTISEKENLLDQNSSNVATYNNANVSKTLNFTTKNTKSKYDKALHEVMDKNSTLNSLQNKSSTVKDLLHSNANKEKLQANLSKTAQDNLFDNTVGVYPINSGLVLKSVKINIKNSKNKNGNNYAVNPTYNKTDNIETYSIDIDNNKVRMKNQTINNSNKNNINNTNIDNNVTHDSIDSRRNLLSHDFMKNKTYDKFFGNTSNTSYDDIDSGFDFEDTFDNNLQNDTVNENEDSPSGENPNDIIIESQENIVLADKHNKSHNFRLRLKNSNSVGPRKFQTLHWNFDDNFNWNDYISQYPFSEVIQGQQILNIDGATNANEGTNDIADINASNIPAIIQDSINQFNAVTNSYTTRLPTRLQYPSIFNSNVQQQQGDQQQPTPSLISATSSSRPTKLLSYHGPTERNFSLNFNKINTSALRVCKPGVEKPSVDGLANCLIIGDSIALR